MPLPSSLARYRAISASCSRIPASTLDSMTSVALRSAMPTLTPTVTWLPSRSKAGSSASIRRCASISVSASCRAPICTMANSSPPSRASVSVSRTQARSLPVTPISSRSPAAWPSVSFTSLKRSRSRYSTASAVPSRRDQATDCSSRSRNSARLGNPVSVSCVARCVDRASARRSSRNGHERSTAKVTAPKEPASAVTIAVMTSSSRSERCISTLPMMAPESYTGLTAVIDRLRNSVALCGDLLPGRRR